MRYIKLNMLEQNEDQTGMDKGIEVIVDKLDIERVRRFGDANDFEKEVKKKPFLADFSNTSFIHFSGMTGGRIWVKETFDEMFDILNKE